MNAKEKLTELAKHYTNGSIAALGRMIGMRQASISAWCQRDSMDYDKVARMLPDVSAEWLLRGKGPMILNGSSRVSLTDAVQRLTEEMETQKRILELKDVEISDMEKELSGIRKINDGLIMKYVLKDETDN